MLNNGLPMLDLTHENLLLEPVSIPRLTKAGNRHLRCALFMPALSAIRHNVNIKAFYNHLLDKGKNIRHLCRHAKVVTRYLWYPKNWTTMVLSFMLLLS